MGEKFGISVPEILDTLDIAVTLHHPETGAILGVNETKEELYGYSADELQEMTVEDYSADESRFSQERALQLINAAAEGTPQQFEWHVKRPDGELFWAHVQLRSCIIDTTKCVAATSQDISDIKDKDRRLRLFYRVFRHNLRNDMNIILGYSQQLSQAIEDADLEAQIDAVNKTAQKVASLSDSVKEIEDITNRSIADRSPTEVMSVVNQVTAAIQNTYPRAMITVQGSSDLYVNTNDNLYVALNHILENAVVHCDRDQPLVFVTVNVLQDSEQVNIEIADNGPGIPEIESIIFDNEDRISTIDHNSGLGLWIIKFCAESLDADIQIRENDPRGTVFEFILPKVSPL